MDGAVAGPALFRAPGGPRVRRWKTGKAKPIIHRDLKPSNLMLVEGKPDGQNLKVLDFGIAKMVQDEANPELTGQGDLVGTPST